jgi:hypothetical protein
MSRPIIRTAQQLRAETPLTPAEHAGAVALLLALPFVAVAIFAAAAASGF